MCLVIRFFLEPNLRPSARFKSGIDSGYPMQVCCRPVAASQTVTPHTSLNPCRNETPEACGVVSQPSINGGCNHCHEIGPAVN